MLKVVTLNLWNDLHLKQERLDILVVELLNEVPDIICFQEVTKATEFGFATTAHYVAEKIGYHVVVCNDMSREEIGTAILSKLPVLKAEEFKLSEDNQKAVYAELEHPERNIYIATAHLSWGSLVEGERYREALALNSLMSSKLSPESGKLPREPIGIITGDFNALPDSATLQYLRGKSLEQGANTLWIDSWEQNQSAGYTSSLSNSNAHITALKSNLNTELTMPERRIDYILSYGYAYGRAGSFRESKLFANHSVNGVIPSDHYGVIAILNL